MRNDTGKNRGINEVLFIAGLIVVLNTLDGCSNPADKKDKAGPAETHQAQVQNPEAGMIYADKIACSKVMQGADSSRGNAVFHCYLVGFIDSLTIAKAGDKKDIEAGKYYQYDVQRDWIALVQGDSVIPVFYEPRQRIEHHRHEGVLVFETKNGKEPDTLIYKDSYSSWGTQQLIINSNKK